MKGQIASLEELLMVLRQHGKLWNWEQFSLLSLFIFTVDPCLFIVCLSHENWTFSALRFVFEDISSHRSI